MVGNGRRRSTGRTGSPFREPESTDDRDEPVGMEGGKGGAGGDGAATRLLEESGHADLADIKGKE